jgi:Domain of unknown function (DUF4190)
MTYPPQQPQQPGSWQDPSWPSPQPNPSQQPYADPYGGAPTSPSYGAPTSPSYAVPTGSPAGYPVYPAYGYGPAMPPPPKTNSLALTSMILSLCGLACGLTAPVGAIMGHVARRQIRERGEAGDGMALAGIIVGWILTGLILAYVAFVVIMIIYAANHSSSTTTY